MGLIARTLDGGPQARRGSVGAVRHFGLSRREVFACCRCQGEVTPKVLQNSGYRPDKPMSVQDGVQLLSLGESARSLFAAVEPVLRTSESRKTRESRGADLSVSKGRVF